MCERLSPEKIQLSKPLTIKAPAFRRLHVCVNSVLLCSTFGPSVRLHNPCSRKRIVMTRECHDAEDDSASGNGSRTQTEVEHASVGRLSLETFWTSCHDSSNHQEMCCSYKVPRAREDNTRLELLNKAKGTRIGPIHFCNKVYVSSRSHPRNSTDISWSS